MRNIYVVSDIHGEYEAFLQLLDKINFCRNDELIILGDVLDRGKQPIELLRFVMEEPNIKIILGNHEQMFLDYIKSKDYIDKTMKKKLYLHNGGETTLKGFYRISIEKQTEIIKFLESQPLYYIQGNYILVHAGLNLSGIGKQEGIKEIMKKQTEEDLLWSREEFFRFPSVKGYKVIFGHTPTISIRNGISHSFNIWYDEVHGDKIGIDCGAVFRARGGKLACIRLGDEREFYV